MLTGKLFAKALSYETYLSVSNNLCGKLVSWLESLVMFDESFRVILAFFCWFSFMKLEIG